MVQLTLFYGKFKPRKDFISKQAVIKQSAKLGVDISQNLSNSVTIFCTKINPSWTNQKGVNH